ncbi:hypothetical protein [Micromonospora sp. NPDC005174]|uniref:hypothetical protein n=1 Tax=Micromonospora sp. NPDC005174 TaxID=3157018 RepID=UPI0033B2B4FC
MADTTLTLPAIGTPTRLTVRYGDNQTAHHTGTLADVSDTDVTLTIDNGPRRRPGAGYFRLADVVNVETI